MLAKLTSRIIVQWQDLCIRVHFFQAFADASAYNMVWQAAKWLKDDKGTAAVFGMVQDFSRNQDAFAGIKCMIDDRVAGFDKVRHSAGRCIEGMLFGR